MLSTIYIGVIACNLLVAALIMPKYQTALDSIALRQYQLNAINSVGSVAIQQKGDIDKLNAEAKNVILSDSNTLTVNLYNYLQYLFIMNNIQPPSSLILTDAQ